MSYGVFETLRTYQGKLFAAEAHLRRLRAGARALHIPVALSNTQLIQALQGHCRRTGETRLTLTLTPDAIQITSQPLSIDKNIYRLGVAVTSYPGKRRRPSIKQINRRLEAAAYQYGQARGYFDALLLPEASRSNVFYVKGNVLYTANQRILFGITRGLILTLARQHYTVRYGAPTLQQLLAADECFLTRTTAGIVPVVRINRSKIGHGKPGPVTKQLMRLFDAYTG